MDRVVSGKGTWKMQNRRKVFRNNNRKDVVIGFNKAFNFIADKSANRSKNESWIMHEYTLLNNQDAQQQYWALCKLSPPTIKPSSSSNSLPLPNKRSFDCCSSYDDIHDPMPSPKKQKNYTPMPMLHVQEEASTATWSDSDKEILSILEDALLDDHDDPALPPPPLPGEDHLPSNWDVFSYSQLLNCEHIDDDHLQMLEQSTTTAASTTQHSQSEEYTSQLQHHHHQKFSPTITATSHHDLQWDIQFENDIHTGDDDEQGNDSLFHDIHKHEILALIG